MRCLSHDFDFNAALYAFLSSYHSGQWSRGYRLLCKLEGTNGRRFNPGLLWRGYQSLSDDGKEYYRQLKKRYADAV